MTEQASFRGWRGPGVAGEVGVTALTALGRGGGNIFSFTNKREFTVEIIALSLTVFRREGGKKGERVGKREREREKMDLLGPHELRPG